MAASIALIQAVEDVARPGAPDWKRVFRNVPAGCPRLKPGAANARSGRAASSRFGEQSPPPRLGIGHFFSLPGGRLGCGVDAAAFAPFDPDALFADAPYSRP
ncbi:MAG TPA: hypothetical protein VFS43_22960, partial [Polyangiaceae bacterium]|nr:hypothetical protein [Polyangiaceae bacterium]